MNKKKILLKITWNMFPRVINYLFKIEEFFFSPLPICDYFSHKWWRPRRAKRHEIENKVNLRPHFFLSHARYSFLYTLI